MDTTGPGDGRMRCVLIETDYGWYCDSHRTWHDGVLGGGLRPEDATTPTHPFGGEIRRSDA